MSIQDRMMTVIDGYVASLRKAEPHLTREQATARVMRDHPTAREAVRVHQAAGTLPDAAAAQVAAAASRAADLIQVAADKLFESGAIDPATGRPLTRAKAYVVAMERNKGLTKAAMPDQHPNGQ